MLRVGGPEVKDSMRGFFRLDIPAPPFPLGTLGPPRTDLCSDSGGARARLVVI
jgi:hypothetical protein